MKYQINETPSMSVVPVIELISGKHGYVKRVAIYDYFSVIQTKDGSFNMPDYLLSVEPLFCAESQKLADYSDIGIRVLMEKFRCIPEAFDELKEIRELEIQYRKSKKATSDSSSASQARPSAP